MEPQDTKALLEQAAGHLRAGETKAARNILLQILREDNRNAQAWFMLSFAVPDTEKQINALKKIFLKENATLYVLVLSILYVFLAKISGQEDIVLGTLINTRQNKALNNMMGLFVKKVPLRNYPRGSQTFAGFLTRVNNQVLNVYKNQDYPYEDIVKKIVKEQDLKIVMEHLKPILEIDRVVSSIQSPVRVICASILGIPFHGLAMLNIVFKSHVLIQMHHIFHEPVK